MVMPLTAVAESKSWADCNPVVISTVAPVSMELSTSVMVILGYKKTGDKFSVKVTEAGPGSVNEGASLPAVTVTDLVIVLLVVFSEPASVMLMIKVRVAV